VATNITEVDGETATAQQLPSAREADQEERELEDLTQPEDPVGEAASEEDSTAKPATSGFRRVPNQRGIPEGEVRLYCDACQASFTSPVGQQPETCPQGHWAGDAASEQETQS
jgi:hypothetical protein